MAIKANDDLGHYFQTKKGLRHADLLYIQGKYLYIFTVVGQFGSVEAMGSSVFHRTDPRVLVVTIANMVKNPLGEVTGAWWMGHHPQNPQRN